MKNSISKQKNATKWVPVSKKGLHRPKKGPADPEMNPKKDFPKCKRVEIFDKIE